MDTKKAILWPVIISVLIHVSLLVVAGMIDLRDNIKPMEMISVSIQAPESEAEKTPASKKENKTKEKIKSVHAQKEKGVDINDDDWREDTIYLDSKDVKYVTYLANIKKKFLHAWNNPDWKYPPNSYEKKKKELLSSEYPLMPMAVLPVHPLCLRRGMLTLITTR